MRAKECFRQSPVLAFVPPLCAPLISHFTFMDSMSFFLKKQKYVQMSSLAGKQFKTMSVNHFAEFFGFISLKEIYHPKWFLHLVYIN